MWLVMLLLLASHQALPTTMNPPSLIVQVVDPAWDPVPGADVTVKMLNGKAESRVAHTDKDGYAKFWVKGDKDYAIEAKLPGFKTNRLKRVHLFKHTAHIQLQLKLAGPMTTVY